jgi:hypothetical protein
LPDHAGGEFAIRAAKKRQRDGAFSDSSGPSASIDEDNAATPGNADSHQNNRQPIERCRGRRPSEFPSGSGADHRY